MSDLQNLYNQDPQGTLSAMHRITAADATEFNKCSKKHGNLAAYIQRVLTFYAQLEAELQPAPD